MKTPAFDQPDQQPPQPEMSQPFVSDAQILRPAAPEAAGMTPDLRHLESGASVYSSDGIEIAVVETVRPNYVTIRAGAPGRPVDLPLNAIQRVGDDGHRLDLRVTSADIERLAGADEPGYAHLAAQQPDTLAARDQPNRVDEPHQP